MAIRTANSTETRLASGDCADFLGNRHASNWVAVEKLEVSYHDMGIEYGIAFP